MGADESATDWRRLRGFAALSFDHHTWDPAAWFVGDEAHLNAAGKLVYTNEIVQGALDRR